MSESFCPRLSQATQLLPLIRFQLIGGASHFTLPTGVAIELMPIAEEGLFGYEIVPNWHTNGDIIVGCDANGEPSVRRTMYASAANALRLVTVDGRARPEKERAAGPRIRQHDVRFPDWPAAAEAAWAQLVTLLPGRRRQCATVHEDPHRALDEALSVTHAHLAQWNPFIHFCGLPHEAELGFALQGCRGQHGELIFQRPDIWILRWKAPPQAVYESWSVVLPDINAAGDMVHSDLAS